ncbi:MAG: 5'-methylthioadenosine/adenosylhomocysteine nucleosidase [Oscillospiraceae bacterium]|nr:5'-methylthioadenosine/adenosylhomocysteine nucleosidase [Oscillospiraceae bacterium]
MLIGKSNPTIGIIGAMKSEVDYVKGILTETSVTTISGVEFVTGKYGRLNCVVAVCGIGKVFAAICAQTMILTYHPDFLVNIGVGGSLTQGLQIGDVAIATSVVQHDMDTSPLGDPVGLISGINVIHFLCAPFYVGDFALAADAVGVRWRKGVVASGDCFVCDSAKKQQIAERFDAIVCEMEGGAIGHVCYVNQVDFCVLRAVSDNGDENANQDYSIALELASGNALKVLEEFLKRLAKA